MHFFKNIFNANLSVIVTEKIYFICYISFSSNQQNSCFNKTYFEDKYFL